MEAEKSRKSLASRVDNFFLLNQSGRFTALEGLRAWAILSVFSVHFTADWSARKLQHPDFSRYLSFTTFGHLGVDLFFVLSGFLIFRLITRTGIGFVPFIINRYRRLLPAHVAVILLGLASSTVLVSLANISFLNYFFPGMPALNYITWSLSYEFLFYVLCGVSIIYLKPHIPEGRWPLAFALVSLGLCILLLVLPVDSFNGKSTYRIPDIRFMGFIAGIAVAMFYESDSFGRWRKVIPFLGIFGFLFGLFLARYAWNYWPGVTKAPFINVYYLAADVAFALVCVAAIAPTPNLTNRFFSWRPLRVMGMVSYSFYLSHAYIGIPITSRITDEFAQLRTFGLSYVLSLTISMGLAVFLFHFLEKPYFLARSVANRTPDASGTVAAERALLPAIPASPMLRHIRGIKTALWIIAATSVLHLLK